jgi:hypothetical protein
MRDRKSDAHMKVVSAGPGMVRHHKDEDKTNNTKENLAVEPRGTHTAEHNRTRGLGRLRKALTMHKRGEKLY